MNKTSIIIKKLNTKHKTFKDYVAHHYTHKTHPLSSIEIAELILHKTSIKITPRLIQVLLKKHNLSRTRKQAFHLAINKSRFSDNKPYKITKKING